MSTHEKSPTYPWDETDVVKGGSGDLFRLVWQDDGVGPYIIRKVWDVDDPSEDETVGVVQDFDAGEYVALQCETDTSSDYHYDNPPILTWENTIAYARQVVREHF